MAVNRKHALATLIEEVKAEQGWSDRDLAQRARIAGYPMSHQRINQIYTDNPIKTIVPNNLRALAAALELPLPRIVQAAITAAGLPPIGPPADWSPETAVKLDPELSSQAKRMLLGLIDSARTETGRPTARQLVAVQPPREQPRAARQRPPKN